MSNIKDKQIIKWLEAIGCERLYDTMESHLEDEAELDGRTELQLFVDELSYCISNYNEDGHCWHDTLEEARELMRETKNGTVIPLDSRTLKPKAGYGPWDIEGAKGVINEYKRMVYRYNQLKKKGYHGKWF